MMHLIIYLLGFGTPTATKKEYGKFDMQYQADYRFSRIAP